jgi:hypothetical protein
MGYKNMNKNISFADLALASFLEHNRSLIIDHWSNFK